MPITFCADIQARNHQARARILPNGRNSRLQVALDCLKQAADLAEGGTVVINGDLFDDRFKLDIDVLDAVAECILAMSKRCLVILNPGNHDQFLRDGRIHSLRMFQDRESIIVVPQEGLVGIMDKEETAYISILPFTEDLAAVEEFVKSAANASIHPKFATFLVLHEPVQAALLGNGTADSTGFPLAKLCLDKFEAVILGHYHRPQQILDTNAYYVGSPYQVDAGERGDEKRFLVWDGELKSIPVKNVPRFITVRSVEEAAKYPNDFVDLVAEVGTNLDGLASNVVFTPKVEEKLTDAATAAKGLVNFDVAEAASTWMANNGHEGLAAEAAQRVQEAQKE